MICHLLHVVVVVVVEYFFVLSVLCLSLSTLYVSVMWQWLPNLMK